MKGIATQLISTLIICIGNFICGLSVAWSSDAIDTLKGPLSPLGKTINTYEEGLVGGTIMLGGFAMTPFSGWLGNTLGRKRATLLGGLFFILSWSVITTAANINIILIGRFIQGFGQGLILVTCFPYLSEISQTSIRGTLASSPLTFFCFGTMTAYILGWTCRYETINYISLTLSVTFVVLLAFLKESPAHLLARGEEKEALKSLKFYRGTSEMTPEVLNELQYIKSLQNLNKGYHISPDTKLSSDAEKLQLQQEEIATYEFTQDESSEKNNWKLLWTVKHNRRALIMAVIHMVLLVFGGTIAVQAYASQLFTMSAPGLSSHLCAIVLAVSFAVGGLIAASITDVFGRRTLMVTSAILSALCLALLASLIRWSWGPEWMIPGAVLAYCCCFQMGVANVPFVQMAESFAPQLKGLASTVGCAFMWISNFIVLVLFGPIVATFGLDGAFFLFSLICAITAVEAYFFMKETNGVLLEDIHRMYEEGFLYRRNKNNKDFGVLKI